MDVWLYAVVFATALVTLELLAVFRRGVANYRGYFYLLLLDATLLVITLSEPRLTAGAVGPWPELVGGLVLCVILIFIPRLIDRRLRRALARDRMDVAARLAGVKELLQPGRASTAERELFADLAAVQAGQTDEVIRRLRIRLGDASPSEDALLHERIITVLIFGQRYREAATHFETHAPPEELGRSPGLAVQMVRAYVELGELDRAAEVVQYVEQLARARRALAVLFQVRLVFLAAVGGEEMVGKVLGRLGWIAPRAREMLRAVARRGTAAPDAPIPDELRRFAEAVAERIVADARSMALPLARPARATLVLIAVNAFAFALYLALLGRFDSVYNLIRSGASFHPAVRGGEWWRLWTAMFLHGGDSPLQGFLHIGLNMYALYLLGRVVEPLLGSARFLVVYGVAGLLGNLASVYNPNPRVIVSLGASGAVLGVMGALVVIVVARRNLWPETSRRALLINLLALLAMQIAVGVILPMVDNYAHVGGLLGGAMAAALLLPGGVVRGRAGRGAMVALLALLAGSMAWSTVAVARERVDVTLARLPRHEVRVGALRLSVPSYVVPITIDPEIAEWQGEQVLVDRVIELQFAPHVEPLGRSSDVEGMLRRCMDRDRQAIAKLAGRPPVLEELRPEEVPGWIGMGQVERGAAARQMLYYGRLAAGDRVAIVEVTGEGSQPLSVMARAELERVLASVSVD